MGFRVKTYFQLDGTAPLVSGCSLNSGTNTRTRTHAKGASRSMSQSLMTRVFWLPTIELQHFIAS